MDNFQQQNQNQGNVLESVSAKYAQSNRDADSLRVRLETEDIKDKVSNYLKGVEHVWEFEPKTQIPKLVAKKVGKRMVNDLGHQTIMAYVEAAVSKATVMGNFKETSDLYEYLRRTRRGLTKHLWINRYKYGIEVSEFEGILNTLYTLIEPFMTRTIGDAERGTIRETTVQQDRVLHGNTGFSFNPIKMFKG